MSFEVAEEIADAVLYEGYLLYPYRASSAKNHVRWQFGVLAPRAYVECTGSDSWFAQTECLLEPDGDATVDIRVRGLQVQARTIDVDAPGERIVHVPSIHLGDRQIVAWEEGVARVFDVLDCCVEGLCAADRAVLATFEGGREVEPVLSREGRSAQIVRTRERVTLRILVRAERCGGFYRLTVRVENAAPAGLDVGPGANAAGDRGAALSRALVGTHVLLAARQARFVSLIDAEAEAREAARLCTNINTWPVLVGDRARRNVMLSSPIILYDFPTVAPESPGPLCDGTEIDEILTLRVMTLTDEEKAEARATDERARAIVDRADAVTPDELARLHGTFRESTTPSAPDAETAWRELLNPAETPPPESARVEVAGIVIERGSRVILRPRRRADPIDLFMAGRLARVEGVYTDLEGRTHLAVVAADDPAGDLHAAYGRYFYYAPDEVEPAAHQEES